MSIKNLINLNKLLNNLGISAMKEHWPERDSIEFISVYGDETCNECGADTDSEYCQLCTSHMDLNE